MQAPSKSKIKIKTLSLVLGIAFSMWSCEINHKTADTIIIGKIWTADTLYPWAEALAICQDTLVAVGFAPEIMQWAGDSTKILRFKEKQLIVPGFIDSHVHFLEGGFQLTSVQLRNCNTKEEFINRIKSFASTLPEGSWITGGNWDHTFWNNELPDRQWIDSVTTKHPVLINRLDGHMALGNSLALKIARVSKKTAPVFGGTIDRDSIGRLTGILKDNAIQLVSSKIPPPSPESKDSALMAAMRYVVQHGVTSIHNMSGGIPTFERALHQGTLQTRIYAGMPLADWKLLNHKIEREGKGNKWLSYGGLKGFVDGSLGSRTAAFFKPYADSPNDSGFFINTPERLHTLIDSADSSRLHVMIHAIGDKANHTLLNIYEKVIQKNGPRDRRFRIEHAQHISSTDVHRFASLGIIASMQPYHLIDDGRWMEKKIGAERCNEAYVFRSLLDSKAKVVFGSDWYVAPPIPLMGIYAAVTRRTLDDKNPNGWTANQIINIDEALRAYTLDAAYASFEEKIKGSIEVGKLADLVVIEKDIFTIPPEDIRDVKIEMTIIGGEIIYSR